MTRLLPLVPVLALPAHAGAIWVTNEKDDTISVIDTDTLEVTRTIPTGERPRGITFSRDFSRVYVCASDSNTVQVIDTATDKVYANSLVDGRPRDAWFTADGAELWVSTEIGGTVSVFDTATQTETTKISFAIPGVNDDLIQPVGFAFTPDGTTAFVALGPSNDVAVIDAETFEVEGYILVGRTVWHLESSPDAGALFTTNGVSGDVTVIDVASRDPNKTVKVGRYPWGAAMRP